MPEVPKPESSDAEAAFLTVVSVLHDADSGNRPSKFIEGLIGNATHQSFRRTRLVWKSENILYFRTSHMAVVAVRSNALAELPETKGRKWLPFVEILRKELVRWDDAMMSAPEKTHELMRQRPPMVIARHWLSSAELIEIGLGDLPLSKSDLQWQMDDFKRWKRGDLTEQELSNCPQCVSENMHRNPFDRDFCRRHRWCNESVYCGWTFWPESTTPMCGLKTPKTIRLSKDKEQPARTEKPITVQTILLNPQKPDPESFSDINELKEHGNAMVSLYNNASKHIVFLSPQAREAAEKDLALLEERIGSLRKRMNDLTQAKKEGPFGPENV